MLFNILKVATMLLGKLSIQNRLPSNTGPSVEQHF